MSRKHREPLPRELEQELISRAVAEGRVRVIPRGQVSEDAGAPEFSARGHKGLFRRRQAKREKHMALLRGEGA